MRRSILLLSCLALMLLAGCGNKGPLVMPPASPAAAKTVAPPSPVSVPAPAASVPNPG